MHRPSFASKNACKRLSPYFVSRHFRSQKQPCRRCTRSCDNFYTGRPYNDPLQRSSRSAILTLPIHTKPCQVLRKSIAKSGDTLWLKILDPSVLEMVNTNKEGLVNVVTTCSMLVLQWQHGRYWTFVKYCRTNLLTKHPTLLSAWLNDKCENFSQMIDVLEQ